jgi:hypothetical protein
MLSFDRVILRPFRTLKWIMICYALLGGIAFIIGIYGAVILSLAIFCERTSPVLYEFTLFVVSLFWTGLFIVGVYIVKLLYGARLAKLIEDKTRDESLSEVESRLARAKFLEFDKTKTEKISREDLPKVLQALGVFVPEEEQEHLANTLDPRNTGYIAYQPFSEWFRAVSGDHDGGGESDKEDEDKEEVSA